MRTLVTAAAAFIALTPTPAFAWGKTGHRVVGQIAEAHLTSRARAAVKRILGTESMAEASNWPDGRGAGLPPDESHRGRQERSRPLVEALRGVLDAALRHLLPRSDMAKAIAYGTKRWPALLRFLGDGRLEIDNNIAERALRGIVIGRRNWLFAGSRAGGKGAAAIYTVIQTCKANCVDPQAYITDVIARVGVADDWPASRWDELMPWNWMPPADQPTAQAA